MSNHTKEEWLVDREGYSICVERGGDYLGVANLSPIDHNGIKHVIGDETWANAYLIRTAPQMLEMLKELMAKAYKQNWNDQYPELLEKAEKVLALATAGTPTCDDEGEL
jgi:hypothetical protein